MLLVIGDSNADGAARAAVFPREGEDAPIEDFRWSSGGAGVNVATAFARLGGRARLLSRTGTDATAAIALAAAEGSGVDLSHLQRDPLHTTGVCVVLVSPGGERTFLSHRGANAALAPPSEGVWEGVRRLHVCGHALLEGAQRMTALALVAEAKARSVGAPFPSGGRASRVPVSLDLCLPLIERYGTGLYELFPSFDLVFTNEAELFRLASSGEGAAATEDFDEAVERLVRGGFGTPSPGDGLSVGTGSPSGGPSVGTGSPSGGLSVGAGSPGGGQKLVVKRGALGSVIAWAESEPPLSTARPSQDVQEPRGQNRIHSVHKQTISPFHVTAVDSTAAGDAFVAAFLLAETEGEPPDQCARLANAAGAYQASRPGSADVLPTRGELRAFLAERGAPDERGSLG